MTLVQFSVIARYSLVVYQINATKMPILLFIFCSCAYLMLSLPPCTCLQSTRPSLSCVHLYMPWTCVRHLHGVCVCLIFTTMACARYFLAHMSCMVEPVTRTGAHDLTYTSAVCTCFTHRHVRKKTIFSTLIVLFYWAIFFLFVLVTNLHWNFCHECLCVSIRS